MNIIKRKNKYLSNCIKMIATTFLITAFASGGSVIGKAYKSGLLESENTQIDRIIIENNKIYIELDASTGAFISLINLSSDIQLIEKMQSSNMPPWELIVQKKINADYVRLRNFESFRADVNGNEIDLIWNVTKGVVIKSKLMLENDSDEIQISLEVTNKSDTIITGIEYPIIYGIGTLGDRVENTYLVHPVSGGFLFRAPYNIFFKTRWLRHSTYPDGFGGCGMQFFSYYAEDRGGFYFACYDPGYVTKEFNFFRNKEDLVTSIVHWSWNLEKGNSFNLDYPIIIAAIMEGNWYAPAERYRIWATGDGPGHPEWCRKGRLEQRVHLNEALRWLTEEVGFCTFGISSSQDVSAWIDAFHRIADIPVFHVLGYDWPAWANLKKRGSSYIDIKELLNLSSIERIGQKLREAFKDFTPADTCNVELLRSALSKAGVQVQSIPDENIREVFDRYLLWYHELGLDTKPAEWFPAKFHPRNLEAIKQNGDYFAPFLFDFFAYGHNLDQYGLLSTELRNKKLGRFLDRWMHPATELWQTFHAERDARVVGEYGANANYYDISASNIGQYSDRSDLGCPAGRGKCLTEAYRKVYLESQKAANGVSGKYIPRGTEVIIENYIGIIDFAQFRAGGEVQGDMEGEQFLDYHKSKQVFRIPLWNYVYHEFGPVRLDGFCKLSREFGDYFYYVASRMCLEGSLLELNYEFSSLEVFQGMERKSLNINYDRTITIDENPMEVDKDKCVFLKEIAMARTQFAKKYLAYGKMARPAKVNPEVPSVVLDWYHYNDIHGRDEAGVETVPAVIHNAWTYSDCSLGLLFVNILKEPQKIDVEFKVVSYIKSDKSFKMELIMMDGTKKFIGNVNKEGNKISFDLEPRKVYLLEITER